MECFCGCGIKLASRLTDANLLASRVALDLLAWDKVRAHGRLGPEAAELESLIARGENSYGRLVLLLHGEGRPATVEECETWLRESFDQRADRREMTAKGSFFTQPKLNLDESDYEALDRKRPGRSFSERVEPVPEDSGAAASVEDGASLDLADQLERIGRLHAEGVLTDEEFAAAKAAVLRSIRSG